MSVSCVMQGGLGNGLFIASATMSYAWKNGFDYCIPTKVVNPHYPLSPEQKPYIFPGVKYCDGLPSIGYVANYKESTFHYQEIPPLNPNHTILHGYFQSYKYHYDYKEQLMKAFGFDDIKTLYPDTASLHFRCGDYKKYSNHHPVITSKYIISAISKMQERGYTKFLVFSDEMREILRILNEIGYPTEMFEYSVSTDPLWELRLMASCGSNIIANSTFSWWAAYINPNPNKVVVYPSVWFGPDSAHNDTKDLCPPSWIKI